MATGDSTSPGPGPGTGGGEEPLTVDQLVDDDTGCWQITTQTSIYLLDLDARTLLRIPGAGDQGPNPATGAVYPVTALTDDRQPQPLWQLLRCRVGEPMYAHTNADATGVTLRGTTPLRRIQALTAREPDHDR